MALFLDQAGLLGYRVRQIDLYRRTGAGLSCTDAILIQLGKPG